MRPHDHPTSLFVGEMTRQAVDRPLAAVNAPSGAKLVAVACGPGYVAAEAARRSLDAIGTDIADWVEVPPILIARANKVIE